MSERWLEIQSFLSDQGILAAINDLSIAIKQEIAGVLRQGRAERARAARERLRAFLLRLDDVLEQEELDGALGVDPRFRQLAAEFGAAQQDSTNFSSPLMREGLSSAVSLLDRPDRESMRELLACLAELRLLVSRHQQSDAAAIFEDF